MFFTKPLLLLFIALSVSVGINLLLLSDRYRDQIVISVPDGDSLQLQDGRRVRLLGVDAPEKNRCFAEESRQKLEALTLSKHIRITDIATDDFGRQLGLIYVGNTIIQNELISGGFVKFTGTSSQKALFEESSSRAKEQQLGIYSPACRPQQPTNDCNIKGNTRSGNHIYHLPTCKNYKQTEIDLSYGDQWFCTEQEAQKAGFTKATGC